MDFKLKVDASGFFERVYLGRNLRQRRDILSNYANHLVFLSDREMRGNGGIERSRLGAFGYDGGDSYTFVVSDEKGTGLVKNIISFFDGGKL